MNTIKFSKMHGLSNDFMVVDGVRQTIQLNQTNITKWANRRTGIGFDQLLLIEKATQFEADFFYRIFNADGSEVAQCGNGARCAAQFIHQQQLSTKTRLNLQTQAGMISTELLSALEVRVNMGVPRCQPADIPFLVSKSALIYQISLESQSVDVCVVSMGNPHAVIIVDKVATAPVQTVGAALESHILFPKRVNVGFMEILNRHEIKLRVFERGAGETQACGSGACAAVVAGCLQGLLAETVNVMLPGGNLLINWAGGQQPVWMTGTAEHVYDGIITRES